MYIDCRSFGPQKPAHTSISNHLRPNLPPPLKPHQSWVEEEQVKNIKTYYKPEDGVAGGQVPYLGFLVGVVVAMIGATVAVVAQTS